MTEAKKLALVGNDEVYRRGMIDYQVWARDSADPVGDVVDDGGELIEDDAEPEETHRVLSSQTP